MKMKIVALSALFGIATLLGLAAQTVQWPEKNPSFSITLPDGWSCKPVRDGDLECEAEDDSGLVIQAIASKWRSEEEMRERLPSLCQKITASLKNAEQGKIQETTTRGNVKLLRLDTAGSKEGTAMVVWIAAFKTGNNPYTILTGAIGKDDPEHEKRIAQILNSISPAKSE